MYYIVKLNDEVLGKFGLSIYSFDECGDYEMVYFYPYVKSKGCKFDSVPLSAFCEVKYLIESGKKVIFK